MAVGSGTALTLDVPVSKLKCTAVSVRRRLERPRTGGPADRTVTDSHGAVDRGHSGRMFIQKPF